MRYFNAVSFVTGHAMSVDGGTVAHWIIDIWSEVPLVEELATADNVQNFVCGHVRWSDGEPGPAIELEDIDFTTVDWAFVLKAMHAAL